MELVGTDELMEELLRRCDHGVVGMTRCGDPGPKDTSVFRKWKGNSHTCAGLAFDVAEEALAASKREARPYDGGMSR